MAKHRAVMSQRLAKLSPGTEPGDLARVVWIDRGYGSQGEATDSAVAHASAGRVDLAIDLLEYRLTLRPDDAASWSNLAAAYLSRARQTGGAEDLPRALDAAARAARLAPGLLEAQINLALAVETLGVHDQAARHWRIVATAASGGADGQAAARRSRALAGMPSGLAALELAARALTNHDVGRVLGTCRTDPQALREVLETVGWPRWARLVVASESLAAREFDFLRIAAECLAGSGGDRLALATARHLVGASPAVVRHVAEALLEYDRGRTRYDSDDIAGAQPHLLSAAEHLASAGSPFACRARFQHGLTLYYAGRLSDAAATFEEVDQESRTHGYHSLVGRVAWLRGLMRGVPEQLDARLDDYGEARAAFQRGREAPHVAAVEMLLAESYQLYGDRHQAWPHRIAALKGLTLTYDRRRRHAIWLDATRACLSENLPDAALWFTQRMLTEARAWGRPAPITESLGEQARVSLRLRDATAALADAEAAMASLQRVSDSSLRARLEPFVVATLADALLAKSPVRARQLTDAALDSHRRGARGHHIPTLRRLRARSFLLEGRRDLAWEELAGALAELDEQRGAFSARGTRLAYVDSRWALREDAIRLKLDQGDSDAAFSILERGRAREFLADAPVGELTLTTARLSGALPLGQALVSFLALDDRLVSWCLTRGRTTFSEHLLSRASLGAAVAARRAEIGGGVGFGTVGTPAGSLDAMMSAALACAGQSHTLLLVPDDVLWDVPFAALQDTASGRPLLHRFRIAVGPSAGALLALGSRSPRPADRRTHALAVVGDGGGGLAALPHARREADAVASLYGHADVVPAMDFSPTAFVDLASGYEVIHFAGHARVDPLNPELSHLVLRAGSPTRPPAYLFPRDLAGRRLLRTQVVVLAACQTGRGRLSRTEGGLSLARPFLEAGATTVVASFWDVDDRATAVLMDHFHRGLARHGDAARALRDAQLMMEASDDERLREPSAWAAFYAIGGVPRDNPRRLAVSRSVGTPAVKTAITGG